MQLWNRLNKMCKQVLIHLLRVHLISLIGSNATNTFFRCREPVFIQLLIFSSFDQIETVYEIVQLLDNSSSTKIYLKY